MQYSSSNPKNDKQMTFQSKISSFQPSFKLKFAAAKIDAQTRKLRKNSYQCSTLKEHIFNNFVNLAPISVFKRRIMFKSLVLQTLLARLHSITAFSISVPSACSRRLKNPFEAGEFSVIQECWNQIYIARLAISSKRCYVIKNFSPTLLVLRHDLSNFC